MDLVEPDTVDLNNSCRTCLEPSEELESVFELFYNDQTFSNCLKVIAPITIAENDGFPQKICLKCKQRTIDAYEFRNQCVNSEENLKSMFKGFDAIIKEEDLDNEEFLEDNEEYLDDDNDDKGSLPFCFTNELIEVEKEEPYESSISVFPETSRKSTRIVVRSAGNKKVRAKKHKCDICGHCVESPSKLLRHMNVHKKGLRKKIKSSSQDGIKEEVDDSEYQDDKPKRERPKKHECPICQVKLDAPSKLKRHLKSHLLKDLKDRTKNEDDDEECRNYSCNFCNNEYEDLQSFLEHLKGTHDINLDMENLGPLLCRICQQKFNTESALERHHIVHTDIVEESKIIRTEPHDFVCIICSITVQDYNELINHMRNHRAETENKEIACQLCTKTFSSLKNIIRHAQTHEENSTHECVKCKRKYGMGDAFIDHMLVHQGMKPFSCDKCDRQFLKYYQLKNHLKAHTSQPKPHLCPECGKAFAEADYLNRHLKRHSGIKPHQCPTCPKSFTFKYSLTAHMAYHSGTKSHYCEVCGGSFASTETLRKHQRIHNNDRRYKCDQCPMKFTVSSYLARHMRTHTGEKPYQCRYCDRAYAQSNDLVKHTRIHVGQNTYKCEFCEESFRLHGNLKEHLLIHYKAMKMTGDPNQVQATELAQEPINLMAVNSEQE